MYQHLKLILIIIQLLLKKLQLIQQLKIVYVISTTGTELKYVKQYTGKYINLRTGVYFLHSGEKITMKSYGANYQNRTLIKVV